MVNEIMSTSVYKRSHRDTDLMKCLPHPLVGNHRHFRNRLYVASHHLVHTRVGEGQRRVHETTSSHPM